MAVGGTQTASQHREMMDCRDFVHDALGSEMANRHGRDVDVWIAAERQAVTDAANEWASVRGCGSEVTVEDVERVENLAVGHVDYGRKLALYVAEIVTGWRPRL